MSSSDWVNILEKTLADFRLSRSEKQAIRELIGDRIETDNDRAVLRNLAFDLARENMDVINAQQTLQWLEEIVKIVDASRANHQQVYSEAIFSTEEDCVRHLRGIIAACRKSIDVCVFTITDDRLATALLEAHHRKVKVRIVSDDEKSSDLGSDVFDLKRQGVAVKTDRDTHYMSHMHHKFAIFDGDRLLNGSYNWTRSASQKNEENYIVTDDKRLVREFASHFEKLWHLFD